MILVAVCALVATAGVGLVARAAFPGRPSLTAELDDLLAPPLPRRAAPAATGGLGDLLDGLGGAVWAQLNPDGDRFAKLASDLSVMDRTPEQFVRQSVTTAVLLGLLVPVVLFGVRLIGLHVPTGVAVLLVLMGAAAGAIVPRPALRGEAEARRSEMRQVVAVICDLAAVVVAAGDDVDAALMEATGVGDGWAFDRLRTALAPGLSRQGPWLALEDLGNRLGVEQLVVLAQNMGLAEEEGAKIREALNTQSKTLREEEASEIEAQAGSVTERMSFPMVMLLLGFILVIGYPAVARL
jgi:Flp pilus assembly protein TadB